MAVPTTLTLKRSASMTTYLYWIRHPEQTEPNLEGYIGITQNPKSRFQSHKTSGENTYLQRNIVKGATMEILREFNTREEALTEEIKYRPERSIGWNIMEGGGNPPILRGKDSYNWKRPWSAEKLAKQRIAQSKPKPRINGKDPKGKHSEANRLINTGRKWYNDGEKNYRLKPGDTRSETLTPGRLISKEHRANIRATLDKVNTRRWG